MQFEQQVKCICKVAYLEGKKGEWTETSNWRFARVTFHCLFLTCDWMCFCFFFFFVLCLSLAFRSICQIKERREKASWARRHESSGGEKSDERWKWNSRLDLFKQKSHRCERSVNLSLSPYKDGERETERERKQCMWVCEHFICKCLFF